MKNAILLHGSGGTPKSHWLPSIKGFLEKKTYEVWAPQLPDADKPDLKKLVPFVLKNGIFNEETILIGHSSGCPLILSILENIKVKISKAILVAGYARPLSNEPDSMLQKEYDWEKIRRNAKEIIFINSDNDPWGCNDKEGAYMAEKVGGKLIILHGEGHMGSDKFNQPYKEFPLLEKLLEA